MLCFLLTIPLEHSYSGLLVVVVEYVPRIGQGYFWCQRVWLTQRCSVELIRVTHIFLMDWMLHILTIGSMRQQGKLGPGAATGVNVRTHKPCAYQQTMLRCRGWGSARTA